MKVFSKSVKITLSKIILIVLIVLLIGAIIIYFLIDNPSSIWGALFGSLAVGLFVAIIQYLIAWEDYAENEKLKELKLIEVLYNRATKSQYGEYIKNTNERIDVMGVTAVRFFRDFADTSAGAPLDARVLLTAMEKGIHVRILLPKDSFIPDEKRANAVEVKKKYDEIKAKYPNNIEIRYFNHTGAHSIFRTDDTCIIGPIFPDLESRNTPALRVMKSSPLAIRYMEYFKSEWEKAKS